MVSRSLGHRHAAILKGSERSVTFHADLTHPRLKEFSRNHGIYNARGDKAFPCLFHLTLSLSLLLPTYSPTADLHARHSAGLSQVLILQIDVQSGTVQCGVLLTHTHHQPDLHIYQGIMGYPKLFLEFDLHNGSHPL